jgi:hypothetical protein
MNRNKLILFFVFVLLLVGGLSLFSKRVTNPAVQHPPSVAPSPGDQGAGGQEPSLAPKDSNIIVESPRPQGSVQFPILITGRARVFENQLNYRIVDVDGKVLSGGNTTANAKDAGEFGAFTITIQNLGDFTSGNINIEVFDYSAKDGSEIDKITIPVTLQ